MDVTGLVIGIVGLYSTCQSCYNLYTDVRDAETSAVTAAHELEIHKSILKAWGFYWQIQPTLSAEERDGEVSEKLKRYLTRYPDKAIGIASALHCIGEALSDKRKLLDTYGLEVNLEVVQGNDVVNGGWRQLREELREKKRTITSRITLTRRFAWALRDAAKFQVLITVLKKHNDSLHLLGPEWAFELLQISLVLDYLPRHDAGELEVLEGQGREQQTDAEQQADAEQEIDAEQEMEAEQQMEAEQMSPSEQGLQVLADLAEIKMRVAQSDETEALSPEEEARLVSFQPDDLNIRPSGMMAVWLSGRETVLIERHNYEADDEESSQRIRANILKLGRLLQLPACARHLHTLELLGLVDLKEEEEIGFVFRLPAGLGQARRGFPVEDTGIRRPRETLSLREGDPLPVLGWRFDLARKMVQSVAFLHGCGWLHKNIRTEELYFFPKTIPVLSREWESMDFEHPFLLGYRYSRPDDVRPPRGEHNVRPREEENEARRQIRFASDSVSNASEDSYEPPAISSEPQRVHLDVKHHPSKRAHPDRRYCHAFDVYSLGIALLEIGLWKPIETLLPDLETDTEEEDPFETRRRLIRRAQRTLSPACGDLYTGVTIACLSVDPEESDIGLAEQRELCARIAVDLAQCRA